MCNDQEECNYKQKSFTEIRVDGKKNKFSDIVRSHNRSPKSPKISCKFRANLTFKSIFVTEIDYCDQKAPFRSVWSYYPFQEKLN